MHIDWPADGQSAIQIQGLGTRVSPGARRQVPIASVAKVMTAYVVLKRYPLDGSDGFTMTMTATDEQLSRFAAATGQSYVPVETGEVITEREALEAILLPSANNIAVALAEHVGGSVPAFVAMMNAEAARVHLSRTIYTDPSGLADSTVSTARDQLKLVRVAFREPAFAAIVSMPLATIPVAGTVRNTDVLLGHGGFIGGKTGSDEAAGGCFVFKAVRRFRHRPVVILGAVLGQRSEHLVTAGQSAAATLVDDIAMHLGGR
jgi:D-alanyl-D-alanine carboxypeptidase (penicillin-binding protein 5/6)